MKQLRAEERDRLMAKYPKKIENFRPGDKVAVTQTSSLSKEKLEVFRGMVISRDGKPMNYSASFRVIFRRLGETFEMSWPLWCPFLKRVDVIEKGTRTRKKLHFIRDRPPEYYEVR